MGYLRQCLKERIFYESLSKKKSISKPKKVFQNMRKWSKHQKKCQILKKCVKSWESVSKHERVCQNIRKCVKTWESVSKHKKSVSKHKKVCQNIRKHVKTSVNIIRIWLWLSLFKDFTAKTVQFQVIFMNKKTFLIKFPEEKVN